MKNRAALKATQPPREGAAVARVVPVLPVPNRRQVVEGAPRNWNLSSNEDLAQMLVDAHDRTIRMVKALRRDLYARTDSMAGNLADAQKRHAELCGMLEINALMEKSESPKGSPNSGSSLGRVNGHVVEIIEHDRRYVEQLIKSFS